MKLLLLADTKVGLNALKFLIANYPDDLGLVITTGKNEIYQTAKSTGIEVDVFDDSKIISNCENGLARFDLGILAWWPRIINNALIKVPKNGFINFHPSLLPYNRGKNYNFWAIVENAPFGVTLHFVDSGVDTGDIVAQRLIPYDWTDNGGSLYLKAQKEIMKLFYETYPKIRSLNISRQPQQKSEGSYHNSSELEPASRIDLDKEYVARDLLNRLRARTFEGHPACWFEHENERYEVRVQITRGQR